LNCDFQPVLQYAYVWSPKACASNLFISGVPYALDTYHQFTTPVYAVSSRNDQGLLAPCGDIKEIIAFILSQRHTLQHYLRQRLDFVQEIGVYQWMDRVKEWIWLFLMPRDYDSAIVSGSSPRLLSGLKTSQFHMLYDQLVYPLIF
jgi:hypothetical protein